MSLVKKNNRKKSITSTSCSACKFEHECLEKMMLRNNMERIHCNASYTCGGAEAPVDDGTKERKHGWCIINGKYGKKERIWM